MYIYIYTYIYIHITESSCYAPETFLVNYFNKIYILRKKWGYSLQRKYTRYIYS